MEAKTTIEYKGKTYPFYKTNRAQFDFENAGFSNDGITSGRVSDLLALTYFTMRDCARRAGTPVIDSLEQFIDDSDPEIINVFVRLNQARLALEGEGQPEKNGQPEPEVAPK